MGLRAGSLSNEKVRRKNEDLDEELGELHVVLCGRNEGVEGSLPGVRH